MLIVVTSEQSLDHEAEIINLLFENGLKNLHLRKPGLDADRYRWLLSGITPLHHKKIVVHQHHELCLEFDLKGVHFQEHTRIKLADGLTRTVNNFQDKGYTVSSSFHSTHDLLYCDNLFDYVLLSPVFDSISKAGYKGEYFDISGINTPVVGLGGINEQSIKKAFEYGYSGFGILGGVWNTEDSLVSFLKLKHAYSQLKVRV